VVLTGVCSARGRDWIAHLTVLSRRQDDELAVTWPARSEVGRMWVFRSCAAAGRASGSGALAVG
jgi:hypothetical protein